MKISLNELKNTLEKLFEGFGCLDYQQSADMVYWSELLHLSGIERLASFLDKLEDYNFDKTPNMIYESDSIALFDFLNNSCLVMGASIIDFSIVKALRRVEFIAHIQNCRNRSYLISKLIQFKSHNLNAVLKWVKNHYTNYAWIPIDSMYPRHIKIKNEIVSNDEHTTCLLQVTQKNSTPIHMLMDIEKQSSEVEIIGKNIDLSNIMKQGLEVDIKSWNLILQYAKKILVSSNDASLKQAGESFEKDPEDL